MQQRREEQSAAPATPAAPAAPALKAEGHDRGEPGIGAIAALAFIVVMVPGILLYVVLRVVGLGIGPAGLLGLLLMLACVFVYPLLLRRLGWVGRR